MVKLLFILLLLFSQLSAWAQISEPRELSRIRSIDDIELPQNYVEVSEEGLPTDLYKVLLKKIKAFKFTLMNEKKVEDIFNKLTNNSRARMRYAGGYCAKRRHYIQAQFKKMNVVSGQLLIRCPGNRGRLRLKDRSSGHYYSFSNFHDTNIVAIKTNRGNQFRVLDVQFEDTPVSLHDYLTEIEKSQRIRPLRRRGTTSNRGICYWSISTDYLTF